jgi:hypothetical protein
MIGLVPGAIAPPSILKVKRKRRKRLNAAALRLRLKAKLVLRTSAAKPDQ